MCPKPQNPTIYQTLHYFEYLDFIWCAAKLAAAMAGLERFLAPTRLRELDDQQRLGLG